MKSTKRFLAKYFHDQSWWQIDIYAYDVQDAETRCRKLGIQLDGEFIMKISSKNPANFFVRGWFWILNWIKYHAN